ncbi:MAG: hypothetical protein HYW51_03890 [Candidatus Doudnabacteria bacterium]|nr:hypothetical protein [Candidatus Doudnabacteria bacterium]
MSNGLPILGYGGALATVPEIMFSCLVFWTGAVGMVVGSTISFWPEYDLIGNAMRMLGLLIVLPMLVQYFRTRAAGRSQK